MSLGIYYIGYVTRKPGWNVNSANPLYMMINKIFKEFSALLKRKMVINT